MTASKGRGSKQQDELLIRLSHDTQGHAKCMFLIFCLLYKNHSSNILRDLTVVFPRLLI